MTNSPESGQRSEAFLRQRRFGRECAVQFLYQVDQRGDWELAETDVGAFWRRVEEQEDAPFGNDLHRARKFAEKLVRLYRENAVGIDRELADCARNWTLERMASIDRNLLRMAATEIRFLDNIPPAATTDEALEIAKRYGDKESVSFINGILDRLARKDDGPESE